VLQLKYQPACWRLILLVLTMGSHYPRIQCNTGFHNSVAQCLLQVSKNIYNSIFQYRQQFSQITTLKHLQEPEMYQNEAGLTYTRAFRCELYRCTVRDSTAGRTAGRCKVRPTVRGNKWISSLHQLHLKICPCDRTYKQEQTVWCRCRTSLLKFGVSAMCHILHRFCHSFCQRHGHLKHRNCTYSMLCIMN